MTDTARRRKPVPAPLQTEAQLLEWAAKGAVEAMVGERRVAIDRGIPGERVVASIDRRRRPWRGVVDEVLEAAPNRIAPPCPYYREGCGGCQWQHLDYPSQLENKRQLVERELVRNGLTQPVGVVHGMDEPWRYRRTAAIAVGWEAGFRPRGRRGIIEIHDCPISHPLIGALAARLNDLLRAGRLPNYHGKVWLDCTVVGSEAEPRLQVLLQGIVGLMLETHPELPDVAAVLAEDQAVEGVAYRHRDGSARPLVGGLMSTIEVLGRPMYLPAGAFFQTNLLMLRVLFERLAPWLRERPVRQAADVYGGVGTFGLNLAADVEDMTLIELDAQAIEAARRTAGEWGMSNVTFVSRHAEKALPELPDLDAVIVDPPRSGLGDVVVGALLDRVVPLLLYVSCSPASLARDLAQLTAGGYHLQTLEIFDFYPQTYHVESLAVLTR